MLELERGDAPFEIEDGAAQAPELVADGAERGDGDEGEREENDDHRGYLGTGGRRGSVGSAEVALVDAQHGE